MKNMIKYLSGYYLQIAFILCTITECDSPYTFQINNIRMHIVRKYTNCRDTLKTSQTTFIDFPMYNKKEGRGSNKTIQVYLFKYSLRLKLFS